MPDAASTAKTTYSSKPEPALQSGGVAADNQQASSRRARRLQRRRGLRRRLHRIRHWREGNLPRCPKGDRGRLLEDGGPIVSGLQIGLRSPAAVATVWPGTRRREARGFNGHPGHRQKDRGFTATPGTADFVACRREVRVKMAMTLALKVAMTLRHQGNGSIPRILRTTWRGACQTHVEAAGDACGRRWLKWTRGGRPRSPRYLRPGQRPEEEFEGERLGPRVGAGKRNDR